MTRKGVIALVARAIVNGDINSRRQLVDSCNISRRTLNNYIEIFINDEIVFRTGTGRGVKIHFSDAFRKRVQRGYYDG